MQVKAPIINLRKDCQSHFPPVLNSIAYDYSTYCNFEACNSANSPFAWYVRSQLLHLTRSVCSIGKPMINEFHAEKNLRLVDPTSHWRMRKKSIDFFVGEDGGGGGPRAEEVACQLEEFSSKFFFVIPLIMMH